MAKNSTSTNSRATNFKAQEEYLNIVKLNNTQNKKVELIPMTLKQEEYVEKLLDDSKSIVFAVGPAGSGKTHMATIAAIKALKEGKINKVIITRPAVGADEEQHGFLPGTLLEKLSPWMIPILDVFKEFYQPYQVEKMLEDEIIEIAPMAFLRGRNLKHAFIIADEVQNCSPNMVKLLLTRLAEGSKMIVTGDLKQHDRKFTKENGLKDILEKLKTVNSKTISVVEFSSRDIQRHPVVKEVLALYGEE